MNNSVSLRSNILLKVFRMMKLRGQFLRTAQTGVDKMGRDEPSKLLLKGIEIGNETFEGRRVIVLNRRNSNGKKTVIFVHGGAYVCKPNGYHWDLITDFTRRTDTEVYCIDYPLTPEYHSGAAFEYVKKFYLNLIKEKDENNIYLMGDSAGSGLILSLLLALRNEQKGMPRKAILLSPFLDLNCDDPRMKQIEEKDPFISLEDIEAVGTMYAGSLSKDDWRVSPLLDSCDGLCPISIYTSDLDTIHSNSLRLREKLENLNINFQYYCATGMVHDWMLFRLLPEAKKVRKVIASELLE